MHKKVLVLILAFLVSLNLFSFKIYAQEEDVMIRIGLYFASTAKDTVNIGSSAGMNIIGADGAVYTINEAKTLPVSKAVGGFLVGDVGIILGDKLEIKPLDGAYIEIENAKYRGYVELLRQDGSDMTVINVVNLEEYLYSVVGKEMSPSFNIEALKAQAVCARNYALTNMDKYKKYNFNLCNTQNSQVYLGVSAEHPNTIKAVEETRGVVAVYDGKLANLFFFASSGGRTENSENVWTTPLPYLKGVDDPYENPDEATRANWTVEISKEDVKKKLADRGIDIGDILDIVITKRTENDRVYSLKFIGTNGEKEVFKENARNILGLYNQNFIIKKNDAVFYDISGKAVPGNSYALTAGGKAQVLSILYVLGKDGIKEYKSEPSDKFTFVGKGWGHGVGMSQWGAKGMADNGFTYDQILKHYFTGVEIVDAYNR
ncbi:MAG: SpoIID/LytB domain-containing protein [Clostridiaceae bacterium]|nr:SpoIID/LytB domain-containing protein [Clostridiaceae bacterium]